MEELSILADLIIERNEIGGRISSIVGRPAMIGHVGEFIASKIFAIRLEESASARGIDGHFKTGKLNGDSVNIKWYSKQESILDINPSARPDFYLVMTGPTTITSSSKGDIRPWHIEQVFLFDSEELLAKLKTRGVKIGIATSVRKDDWREAEIYPNQINTSYILTDSQKELLNLFRLELR